MLLKKFLGVLIILFIVGSASADTHIEYTMDGDWFYESEDWSTLSLSNNPSYGINVTIDVPTGMEEGGLSASRHDLPGFSLENDGFIELCYSSLTSTITGIADFSLYLEVEFYDSESKRHQIAMGICQSNESTEFETWFTKDGHFDYFFEEPFPVGLSKNKGTFGLYCHDNIISPYFKDEEGNVVYPFSDWDISQIVGMNGFSVDNDFEAYTLDGGAVNAFVNLEEVIYSVDICEGDFDNDKDVDGSDLAIFAADFGRTDCDSGDPCEGDFDKDGDVDGSDLATFAADFGRTDCL